MLLLNQGEGTQERGGKNKKRDQGRGEICDRCSLEKDWEGKVEERGRGEGGLKKGEKKTQEVWGRLKKGWREDTGCKRGGGR